VVGRGPRRADGWLRPAGAVAAHPQVTDVDAGEAAASGPVLARATRTPDATGARPDFAVAAVTGPLELPGRAG